MPLLSTMGGGSVRGWIPRGNPPKVFTMYMVGGGGLNSMQTVAIYNWYGPTVARYSKGGSSGEVKLITKSLVPGTTYTYNASNAQANTTAFGETALAGAGKITYDGGSSTTYTPGSDQIVQSIYSDWDGAIGGFAFGGGGAGSWGNGGNANSGVGYGGNSYNLTNAISSSFSISPAGAAGYGEYIYYGSVYTYFSSYGGDFESSTMLKNGSGGNQSGYYPPKPGIVVFSYDSSYDDPKSITSTVGYTKETIYGSKVFTLKGEGTVTF